MAEGLRQIWVAGEVIQAVFHDLPERMIAVMERVHSRAVSADEINVSGSTLNALERRGFMCADRDGLPTIYRLTPKGEALVELLHQPIMFRPNDGPTLRIQRRVAQYFKIPLQEMWSERRSRGVARPRQVAMYFAREMTPLSLPAIGQRFGKRDHTTVIHALDTVERLIAEDSKFAADVEAIRKALEE